MHAPAGLFAQSRGHRDPVARYHTTHFIAFSSVRYVRKMGREGRTVVVSSHILHEVEAMTRRVLLVHNGRILAEGDVRADDVRAVLPRSASTSPFQWRGCCTWEGMGLLEQSLSRQAGCNDVPE